MKKYLDYLNKQISAYQNVAVVLMEFGMDADHEHKTVWSILYAYATARSRT